MKVVSLFTGCGGLDLGLHKAGHEIILQCECDPGAQQVLRKAFPGTLLVPDICSLQSLPKETEVVAAGFPCIDVSRAGLRQGLDGPSTGLVRHVFRLLAQARDDQRPVPWVLLENVEALLDRCHGGPPLVSWVVSQLEKLGYKSWAHRVICSAGFGVPNRRRRIFILASMHGDARDVLLGQGLHRCMGGCLGAVGGDCWECFDPDDDPTTGSKSEAAMLRCSYALDLGNARSAAGVDVVPTFTTSNARICLLLSNGRYGALRIEDAERLQGLPPGHTQACYPIQSPGVKQHRGANLRDSEADTRDRARFALLGNAVTVQVALWVGERLADPYRHKYLPTDNDMPLHKEFQPADLEDSVWQALREVRTDQIHGVGASSGAAKIVSRGAADWEQQQAAAAAAADGDGSSSDEDTEQVAKDPVDAALAVAAKAAKEAQTAAAAYSSDEENADSSDSDQEPAAGSARAKAAAAAAAAVEAAADTLRAEAAGRATRAAVKKVISQRIAPHRLSSAWPKAAWFVRGHGRWGLKEVSDTPVKALFLPLGEFIRKVGPSPPDVALVTYLQRLKEQGWNVDRTERKMIMCGVTTTANATAADGLQDMLAGVFHNAETDTAANSIGRLVWARLYNTAARPTHNNPAAAGSSAAAAAGNRFGSSPGTAAAAASAGIYWPCEEIDPFRLPRGFKLLPEHRLALTVEERKLYLPAGITAAGAAAGGTDAGEAAVAAPEKGKQPAAAVDTPAEPDPGVAEGGDTSIPSPSAAAAAADAGTAAVATASKSKEPAIATAAAAVGGAGAAGPDPSRRKVLLIWFHTNRFEWRYQDELLPFEQHKARLKSEAVSLMSSNKLTRPQEWKRAYKEAKHCSTILKRAVKIRARAAMMQGLAGPGAAALAAAELSSDSGSSSSDDDGDGGDRDHRAAVAGRAAKQAMAVNIRMPRCKVCEACTQSTGSTSRRCLLVRATAAAAAGHAGAQLSVLGDKCVGAEIDVWWPLDAAYYKGVITAYDNLRVRHTINYEDGDVEIIPLWAPQQRIKLRTQPAQWVARAAQLAAQRAEVVRDIQAARLRVAGAGGLPDSGNLTAMEQERAENILRNKEALMKIMADQPLEDLEALTKEASAAAAAAAVGPASPTPAPAAAAVTAPPSQPTAAVSGAAGAGLVSSSIAPKTPAAGKPPKASSKVSDGAGKATRTKCTSSASEKTATNKPRGRPPKSPAKAFVNTAAAAAAAAAAAVAGDLVTACSKSTQQTNTSDITPESPATPLPQANPVEMPATEGDKSAALGDIAGASSSRGVKRQAAAAAGSKIRTQVQGMQSVKGTAGKKRKQAAGKTASLSDLQVAAVDEPMAAAVASGVELQVVCDAEAAAPT